MTDQVTVPVETVDGLVAKHQLARVHVVKMDVQGYEPFVLDGIQETIERHRPIIVTEVWPSGMAGQGRTPEDLVGPLLRRGYVATRVAAPSAPLTTTSELMATCFGEGVAATAYENIVFRPTDSEN